MEENDIRIPLDENSNDVTAFLAKQAVKATTKLKIRAIITDSYQGRTARNLAAFRGKYPVLAICYKEKTMRHYCFRPKECECHSPPTCPSQPVQQSIIVQTL